MFSAVSLNFSRLICWDFASGSPLAAAAVLHIFLNISLFWKFPAETHLAKVHFPSYNIAKTTYISIFYKNNEYFSHFCVLSAIRYFAHFYRILLSFSGHFAVMHRASYTFLRRLRKYKKLEENAPPLCYNIAIKKKAAKAAEKGAINMLFTIISLAVIFLNLYLTSAPSYRSESSSSYDYRWAVPPP